MMPADNNPPSRGPPSCPPSLRLQDDTPLAATTTTPTMKWPHCAQGVESRIQQIEADTEAVWDGVAGLPDEDLTYDSVVAPLVSSPVFKTNPLVCEAKFLQHCSEDGDVRLASSAAGARIKQLRRRGRLRPDVYSTVQRYERKVLSEGSRLSQAQTHFLTAVLRDFRRSGLQLAPSGQSCLERLRLRESDLCRRYNANVGQDQTVFTFSAAELDGVGPAFIEAHRAAPGVDAISVSLKYHDVLPVMSCCSVGATRRRIAGARETCYADNLELMVELVQLRQELARLLGYPSYAHYACEGSMVGSPEEALRFLEELHARLEPSIRRDYACLLEKKRMHAEGLGGDFDDTLRPWDVAYYTRCMAEQDHGVDEQALMMHFPLGHVVRTTLSLYEGLLGLVFTEAPPGSFDTWNSRVRLYHVSDAESSRHMGAFYLDLHPRPGKYAHAAIFFVRKRTTDSGPAVVMLANLHDPPAGCPDTLLRHREVVTFFHEFGHAMHGICADGEGNMTRLAKCPRDFMEVTSQMLENWCWDPAVLTQMSCHVTTGEPLPAPLIAQIVGSRYVAASMDTANHIFLSYLDLSLHSNPPDDAASAQALIDTLRPRFSAVANPTGWNLLRNFCHVTDHYPSAYYSYLWSEVISADMFRSRFADGGGADTSTGMEYRRKVLAPGGMRPAMTCVEDFLGRTPSQTSFLKSRGVAASEESSAVCIPGPAGGGGGVTVEIADDAPPVACCSAVPTTGCRARGGGGGGTLAACVAAVAEEGGCAMRGDLQAVGPDAHHPVAGGACVALRS